MNLTVPADFYQYFKILILSHSTVANWTILLHHASRKSGKEASEYGYGAGACVKMSLAVTDGTAVGLTGVSIYFIRTSTKRTLG